MGGRSDQFASARFIERLDIGSGDHTFSLGDGVAYGVYCDTAGEILKIDNTEMTGYTTLALQAGWNPLEVIKVYQTGSTVAGDIDLYSW